MPSRAAARDRLPLSRMASSRANSSVDFERVHRNCGTVAAQIQNQVPLGRFGKPEEIAATVLHPSAPESSFIVGTEIIAEGGMSRL